MGHQMLGFLLATAAAIGVVHTLTGPDHYVPFVAMSRVGRWSLVKTIVVTLLCGLGHVGSSIVIGVVGIAAGLAVGGLERVEAGRGSVAGWLLLGFGLAYMAWGIRRAIRHRPHVHWHAHEDGTLHTHRHVHTHEHTHVHAPVTEGAASVSDRWSDRSQSCGAATSATPRRLKPAAQGKRGIGRDHGGISDEFAGKSMTPWVLFTIFVFGPCEPLIPLLMYPAAKLSLFGVLAVTAVFAVTTLATMTTVVMLLYLGLARLSAPWLARYSHAMAGFALAACGAAVTLGL